LQVLSHNRIDAICSDSLKTRILQAEPMLLWRLRISLPIDAHAEQDRRNTRSHLILKKNSGNQYASGGERLSGNGVQFELSILPGQMRCQHKYRNRFLDEGFPVCR